MPSVSEPAASPEAAAAPLGVSDGEQRAQLKRKTARSVFWALVRILFEQGLSFIVFVALARLLTPRDMGVFALGMVFFELGKIVVGTGFADAVIREPHLDEELADTIFWGNIGVSLLVTLVIFVGAPTFAHAVHEPGVRDLMWALGCLIPVSAIGTIHTARKQREFGYRSLAGRTMVAGVVGGGLGLFAAARGFGPWALVFQRGSVELVWAALAWQAFPWLPRRRFSLERLGHVYRFSLFVMLTQLSWTAMVRVQDFVVGRSLNAASVGTYRLAWRGIDLLVQFGVSPFVTIALPTLARMQHDRYSFNNALLRLHSVAALVACPAMLGFGAVAPVAVPQLFGPHWVEAGRIAQILAFMALPQAINGLSGPVFSALGQSGTILKLALLQLVTTIVVTAFAAPFGLEAVAVAYVLRAHLLLPLQLRLMSRATTLAPIAVLRAIAPPFFCSVGIGAAAYFSLPPLLAVFGPIASLAIVVVGAGALYALLLLAFCRGFVLSQIRAFQSLRRTT